MACLDCMKDDVCIGISSKLIQIFPGVKDSSYQYYQQANVVSSYWEETVKHGDALGLWGLKKLGPKP